MKNSIVAVLMVLLITSGLLAGCGPVRTQTYNFTDFTRIEVGYAFQVEVIQSNSYGISITAPEDLLTIFRSLKREKH